MTKMQEKVGHRARSGSDGCNGITLPLIAREFLKGLHAYREMVDLEVRRASEGGARWWSRRLVEMSEEAGLVHFDE